GGYLKVQPSTAICGAAGVTGVMSQFAAGAACTPDWSAWQIGSRTIWNPVENLDVGVEVMYSRIQTAFAGATTAVAAGAQGAGVAVDDENVWSGIFRVQRNFWP
ncbi:MAG: porin, partial [Pseudolabrys sp.]